VTIPPRLGREDIWGEHMHMGHYGDAGDEVTGRNALADRDP
jgi:hypothetical protein